MHFFEEIKAYIGFDQADAERLEQLKPLLAPHFGAVVDKFYDALNANPRSREIFTGPQQVERLRGTLHQWLEEVFEGPYDNDYFQRRQRIGRVHVDVGLLNTIGLQMTLLERRLGGLVGEEGQESLAPLIDAVLSEVKRIHGLTSEIMDFAKPIDINKSWHNTEAFLDDLRNLYEPTMHASDITLLTRVDGDPMILCDHDRIKLALVNLLQNAVEAIEGSGTIEVVIANEAYGTTITVADNGHGMSPSLKYKIFDLFHTTKAAGTGIGLAIVKKIVEAHDGAIDVTSKPGQGTQFTIALPRPDRSKQLKL